LEAICIAYSATAPMPENMNEYILAGFLRKKKDKNGQMHYQ
jgi:3-polyprenyl-4-hydroxybenzoate decarboxylase